MAVRRAETSVGEARWRARPQTSSHLAAQLVVSGPVRPGRSTKRLVSELARGDIALIDHMDIDRVSAEELIAAGTVAVLNCRASSSGTYPNLGPQLLVEAGVTLVDLPGDGLFGRVADGERITIRIGRGAGSQAPTAEVLRDGVALAQGEILDAERVHAETEARRLEVGEALERFAVNTIAHMREERELLAGRIDMPRFVTDFRDRPTLVVVRGAGHQRDLLALRPFIRGERPLLVGVDGAAEALLEAGLRPDMIVGDMDSAGEAALACGAELVLHCYPDGSAPGRARLRALGLSFKEVPAPGTSHDLALLLAAEKGARPIVSVGAPFNLVEFLDRHRDGMSSTFLTRLRVGEVLVDARGLSRLYPAGGGRLATSRRRLAVLAVVAVALAAGFLLGRTVGAAGQPRSAASSMVSPHARAGPARAGARGSGSDPLVADDPDRATAGQ